MINGPLSGAGGGSLGGGRLRGAGVTAVGVGWGGGRSSAGHRGWVRLVPSPSLDYRRADDGLREHGALARRASSSAGHTSSSRMPSNRRRAASRSSGVAISSARRWRGLVAVRVTGGVGFGYQYGRRLRTDADMGGRAGEFAAALILVVGAEAGRCRVGPARLPEVRAGAMVLGVTEGRPSCRGWRDGHGLCCRRRPRRACPPRPVRVVCGRGRDPTLRTVTEITLPRAKRLKRWKTGCAQVQLATLYRSLSLARIIREGADSGETQEPPCGTNAVLTNV